MKSILSVFRSARMTGLLLLVILFPIINVPGGAASIPLTDSERSLYRLAIYQSRDEICVGDAVRVVINWGPNTDPGKESDPLAPLSGPSRIKLQGGLGHFYPDNFFTPGSISGTGEVMYIAEKAGHETIFAQAWSGGSSDAISKDTFTIKACDYFYDLKAEMNLIVDEAEFGAYSVRYTIKSHDALKAPDPDKPFNLEGKGLVHLEAVMTSWSNKCVLFTSKPGQGMGYVDVKVYPDSENVGMIMELAPPEDFHWDWGYSFACNGDQRTMAGVYEIATTDPWIKGHYFTGGGQVPVKIEMFDIPIQKMSGQPGLSISYTATLTLGKSAPK